MYVQSGKRSLSVAIVDEFYAFDFMTDKSTKKSAGKLTLILNFKINFFLHCILLVTKVKLFQGI